MEGEEKTVTVDIDEGFIVKSDAGDLCRLCANTDNQLIPIYKGEGIEHNISVKIEKHLPIIKVTEIDKLPLQICYQCASTLIAWHNLYEGCLIADKRLREILSIDEKEYQGDDTYDNFVDDYRDDYDDQSRSNYETLPLSSTASTSNLHSDDILKSDSIEISQLSESKAPNETELDSTDERYTSTSQTTTPTPPPGHVESTIRDESAATAPSETPPQHLVERVTVAAGEPLCDCTKRSGGTKCAACAERDSLKCTLCPMVFVEKADIARHMFSSHSTTAVVDEKRNVVRKAVKSATARRNVETDEEAGEWAKAASSSSSVLHRCKVCSKICLSLRGLTRHSVVHRNVGSAPPKKAESTTLCCNYCDRRFANEEDRRDHVSDYHRITVPSDGTDESRKCNVSAFIPNSVCEVMVKEDEEKENMKNEFGDDKENADETAKSDPDANKTTGRKRKRKSEPSSSVDPFSGDTFSCDDCGKTFEKKANYARHKLSHTTGEEFPCDECPKRFSSEMVLKRHKSNVHRSKRAKMSDEEDPFSKWYVFADGQKHLKCDQCKYNSLWYHKGRFLEHYRIHTGEKPFTCDSCGKQFRTKTLLQKHVMFVHEGIKEHACDICGRCFSDKRYMEDHRRIHTGERPYVCDLCGKTFKQSASLFIHKELHKGLRKHSCDMCGKRFTTRSSLTIHIKRHVGERNFICATCGKAFVDGKHLKDHMAVHSEERPFSCDLCGGRFKLMKHLKQHGRTHKREYTTA